MAAMAEGQRRALAEAFGASSSSDDDGEVGYGDGDDHRTLGRERKLTEMIPVWESICEVNGLWLCREFLSENEQHWLLSSIRQEGWFNGGSFNQAMRFGEIPEWAKELAGFVREAVCFSTVEDQPLPSDLLWREPLFDQLIVNVYEPGEGICAHVDLMRFDDGIAIVSLESTCVMHFTRGGTISMEA
ncbi:tRNA (carboxymethyluridine(34)-5-O)-methyltransferase protein [Dioscorea alata]|uniref:tRNA (Carboxymethyluridine(34)-5-O)-methyltransferase protein n=1 Tax=Dioscorea alata TaxID=55571 RepID=A0ACB7U450_DIOAL|nr:tRNA (carboxymethyluridine(34)-5-O)-methyltransferase protein [Dioscorea alata]